MEEKLIAAMADMREDEAYEMAQAMLDAGADPRGVLAAAQKAMGIVGQRYEEKEYFLPELIIAGDMLKHVGDLVKPLLEGEGQAEDMADAAALDELDAVFQGRDQPGCPLRVEDFQGMRKEGDDQRCPPVLLCLLLEDSEDLLVASMDPVEVTHRDHGMG